MVIGYGDERSFEGQIIELCGVDIDGDAYIFKYGFGKIRAGEMSAAVKTTIDLIESQSGHGPVSYTHLDVYKRQVEKRVNIETDDLRIDFDIFLDKGGHTVSVVGKAHQIFVKFLKSDHLTH